MSGSLLKQTIAGLPLVAFSASACLGVSAQQRAEFRCIYPADSHNRTDALAVSADGQTVVGRTYSQFTGCWQAFVWTLSGEWTTIDDRDGGLCQIEAFGISNDGSVVCGVAYNDIGW